MLDFLNGNQVNVARVINSATIGAATSYMGGKGLGLTKATTSFADDAVRISIKVGIKSFAKSALTNASGMYAYDYVNRGNR